MKLSSLVSSACLLAVAVLGSGHLAFDQLGARPFATSIHINVDLARSGGLSAGSPVTLRGVQVGTVTTIRPAVDGVRAELALSTSSPVPANAPFVIQNLSAIGEQYLDFRPIDTAGPSLAEGALIPRSQGAAPITIDQVVDSAGRLVGGIDPADITTIMTTVDEATRGTRPQIQRLTTFSTLLGRSLREKRTTFSELRARIDQLTALGVANTGAMRQLGEAMQSLAQTYPVLGPLLPDVANDLADNGHKASLLVNALLPDAGPIATDLASLITGSIPESYQQPGAITPVDAGSLIDVLTTIFPESGRMQISIPPAHN